MDRGMMESVVGIRREVYQHFANKYVEDVPIRPVMDGAVFKRITEEEGASLEFSFSKEEVKEAIWNCDGSKSLGPDGYYILFIKNCWLFLKEDILACFRDFHAGVVLSKSITSSFLTLILKRDHPLELNDYMPICLIGCIYKILAKVLADRLEKVIGVIISDCQSAFVLGSKLLAKALSSWGDLVELDGNNDMPW
ncbi:uncharacterized protein LOC131658162 [Vicia villosa]|uniref:uncharacterized protein LOC131658162 n=1 Tax=Vicia villosa TaxID=3911 RepID=UPI00273C0B0D|nr:uncharacterized protein LOC131658162 [Vicia villosa]